MARQEQYLMNFFSKEGPILRTRYKFCVWFDYALGNKSRRNEARKQRTINKLKSSLESAVENGVIVAKEAEGLRRYAKFMKARVSDLENAYQVYLASLFDLPHFRKMPLIIVQRNGSVFYQSPASKLKLVNLEGSNLAKVGINCSEPNFQEDVKIGGKLCDVYSLPLIGRRSADFIVLYTRPASMFARTKDKMRGAEADFEKKLQEIRKGLRELAEKLRDERGIEINDLGLERINLKP